MKYSVIIPVYNRPEELEALLGSLKMDDSEVIVVEDGSSKSSRSVVEKYPGVLYFEKENGGPGPARNFGAAKAGGDWLVFLDSDVVVPESYGNAVGKALEGFEGAAWGGPDAASDDFSPLQKAINYSMTSFLTTGGIRGGKKKITKFFPRSFNMGIRRDVFEKLGGFAPMRFGEDVDLSMRIHEAGYACSLFPDAFVYHKRRVDFRKFFRQVFHSGEARVALSRRHPGSLRAVHLLPAAFAAGCAVLLLAAALCRSAAPLAPLALYALLVFADALRASKSPRVALLAVPAAFVQLCGYGSGYISALFKKEGKENIDNEKFYG